MLFKVRRKYVTKCRHQFSLTTISQDMEQYSDLYTVGLLLRLRRSSMRLRARNYGTVRCAPCNRMRVAQPMSYDEDNRDTSHFLCRRVKMESPEMRSPNFLAGTPDRHVSSTDVVSTGSSICCSANAAIALAV